MSEQEMKALKEQIKKELLVEMNTKKANQNVWQKIKEEYEEEFKKFNFVERWEYIDKNGTLIQDQRDVAVVYPLQNAIGTLLRISNKSKTIARMTISYDDAKDIVDKVLEIIREKQERNIEK